MCGLIAIFGYHALNLDSGIPYVGASGAISGLMAAYIILFRHAKLTFMFLFWQTRISAVIWGLIWVAFNVVGLLIKLTAGDSESGGTAWSAHLVGMAAGAVLVFPFRQWIARNTPALRLADWGVSRAKYSVYSS